MNYVDNFLRNMESRYPSIYEMLHGDKARVQFSNMELEIEQSKKRWRSYPNIICRVYAQHVKISKIGGTKCSSGRMEEIPVLIIERK